MAVADEIVSELAAQLRVKNERFYFSAQPTFLRKRLLALEPADRKQVLERLTVFAYFLVKEKGSPEAGTTLLDILEGVAKP